MAQICLDILVFWASFSIFRINFNSLKDSYSVVVFRWLWKLIQQRSKLKNTKNTNIFYASACVKVQWFFSIIYPWKSNTTNAITEHITKNRWIRIASRKIGMESWMLPMCNARHDFRFNILHNCIPILWILWSFAGQ